MKAVLESGWWEGYFIWSTSTFIGNFFFQIHSKVKSTNLFWGKDVKDISLWKKRFHLPMLVKSSFPQLIVIFLPSTQAMTDTIYLKWKTICALRIMRKLKLLYQHSFFRIFPIMPQGNYCTCQCYWLQ